MIRTILPAALAGAMLLFAACGDDGNTSGSKDVAGNGTDRAFVKEMIPHHESAIEMARIAHKRGKSRFVKTLAEDIVRTQSAEISALRREDEGLDTAGVKVGSLDMPHDMMGMDMDPSTLETADPFDPAFLKMMTPHHQGAIAMARVELAKGKDPELRTIAQAIIDAQQREIREMGAQLRKTQARSG
jgi:uncharacterized protein (DUF305 family)